MHYKTASFIVIETEEDFFLDTTNRLYDGYKNHRLLFLKNNPNYPENIYFLGGNKGRKRVVFGASNNTFHEKVKIIHKFDINLN